VDSLPTDSPSLASTGAPDAVGYLQAGRTDLAQPQSQMASLDTLAHNYAMAVAQLKLAEEAKRDAAQALLETMQTCDLERAETPSGKISVCQGRRTVKVTCKALAAEIKATQERAVRTGRAVESIGSPYVMLR
jgi:hypothetical protein